MATTLSLVVTIQVKFRPVPTARDYDFTEVHLIFLGTSKKFELLGQQSMVQNFVCEFAGSINIAVGRPVTSPAHRNTCE